MRSPARIDITLPMKYLRRSRRANIFYFVGGSIWKSSKKQKICQETLIQTQPTNLKENSQTTKRGDKEETVPREKINYRQFK
jgi:hypothetical protein